MGSIRCRCGNIISDGLCPNPDKARFMTDIAESAWYERLSKAFYGYMNSVAKKESDKWLKDYGFKDGYTKLGLSHEDIIHDIIVSETLPKIREILQCEECGRLLLECAENTFTYFAPEEGGPKGLFRKGDGLEEA